MDQATEQVKVTYPEGRVVGNTESGTRRIGKKGVTIKRGRKANFINEKDCISIFLF
jgi:hypothetical protein